MSQLDDAIREALSAEDAELLARFEAEPGMAIEVSGLFRGPRAGVNLSLLILALALAAATLFAALQFARADTVRPLAHWGALTAAGFTILMVIRLWYIAELQSNRILRELKRLELQLARLASRETS